MKNSLYFANKHYRERKIAWEDALWKLRTSDSTIDKWEMCEDTTGYQLTPLTYLYNLARLLYINFGISPKDLKKMSFVDLGCGYGGLLALIKPVFKKVWGVEYNPLLVNYGNFLYNDITVIQGKIQNFSYKGTDILYTFNITNNKSIFIPILKSMKKGQIFIESHNGKSIYHYAQALGFSKVFICDWGNIVIVQK